MDREILNLNSSDLFDLSKIYKNDNPIININDDGLYLGIFDYNDFIKKGLLLLLRNYIKTYLVKENQDKLLIELYTQNYQDLIQIILQILNNKSKIQDINFQEFQLDMFEYIINKNESKVQ